MTPDEIAKCLETEADEFDVIAEEFKKLNQGAKAKQVKDDAIGARLLAQKIRSNDQKVHDDLKELQSLIS